MQQRRMAMVVGHHMPWQSRLRKESAEDRAVLLQTYCFFPNFSKPVSRFPGMVPDRFADLLAKCVMIALPFGHFLGLDLALEVSLTLLC